MKIIEEHDCKKGLLSVKIVKLKHFTSWTIISKEFNINLNFIGYCPYCGVKLE